MGRVVADPQGPRRKGTRVTRSHAWLLAVVAWTLGGIGGPAAHADPPVVTLKLGTIAPQESPYLEGCLLAAKLAAKNSKGAVEVRVLPSGMLGDESQMIDSLRRGTLDMFAGSGIAAHGIIPELAALELPFLFHDGREVDTVIERLWPLLSKTVAQRGYRLIAHTTVGFRHLGSAGPLRTMADLRAVRMRAQPSPLHTRFWELAGVHATPIGQLQVADALAAKTVTGFDSALTWVFAAGWHLHIKEITQSQHMYQPGVILMTEKAWQRIPAPLRAGLFEGHEVLSRANIQRIRSVEKELFSALPGMGVHVSEMPKELVDEFVKATMPLEAEWRAKASPAGRRLLDAIKKELTRLRAQG